MAEPTVLWLSSKPGRGGGCTAGAGFRFIF